MNASLRKRFWIEAGLVASSVAMLVITPVWTDWIEAVFHIDSDRNSGVLEWTIVGVLCALSVVFGLTARSEWRGRFEVVG